MTLPEQLGNIGSDFERAVRWKEKNAALFEKAAGRTLELMDLTLSDKRWHNHRLVELARLREEMCSLLFGSPLSSHSIEGLKKYFLAMATLAQKQRIN
jgi:hypothetical protein